jgi:MFS family permease
VPDDATVTRKSSYRDAHRPDPRGEGYKWIALSNCTLGILLATLDGSITLIAMPDIFKGIHLDPLVASNSFYLLWMILGFLVVSSVLIVSLGRLGDMYGRVRIYNLGFVIYTVASLILTVDWLTGTSGALFLIVFRVVQGVGAACLLANAAAIITDAFPANQRGTALGINNIVGVSGVFVGLVLGGLLAPVNWRLVFLISVPVGLFGTVWAYLKLQELSTPHRSKIDWPGNLSFALGLILIMISVTYGIRPAGHSPTGWGSLRVLTLLGAGLASLVFFVFAERRATDPMFRLPLFRIRAFTFGTLSTFLSSIARGGLMFILVIWLQGIWLPEHGYSFTDTPLWAGIYILPLTAGMLLAGPTSGYLSDRYGSRGFATGGMLGTALAFALLLLLPVDFPYPAFAAILFLCGVSMGLFASPNRAAVMNSLPPSDRGAGGGMNQTFQNSAQVLSIGVFFTLMILGLATSLPHTMLTGLMAHGVPRADALHAAHLPPVSILFAAFLGYNPISSLVPGHVLNHLSAAQHQTLVGRSFFPHLIAAPFKTGLHEAFIFAIVACLIAAAASWSRGGRGRRAGVGILCPAPDVAPARPLGAGALGELLVGADDVHHRVDQRQVGERLGEVAKVAAGFGVDLLGVEAEWAGVAEQPLTQLPRAVHLSDLTQRRDQPERADQERPLRALQAVVGLLGAVTQHQSVLGELIGNREHGRADPRVIGLQKPHQRDQQQRRVQRVCPIVLHEHATVVDAVGADVGVNLLGGRAPASGVLLVLAQSGQTRPAVTRHPAEDLGGGEVPGLAAHLPDATVGLSPVGDCLLDLA